MPNQPEKRKLLHDFRNAVASLKRLAIQDKMTPEHFADCLRFAIRKAKMEGFSFRELYSSQ